MRHGWFMSDVVDLPALTCPPVRQTRPRQVFWQKDLCEDGRHHVRGKSPVHAFPRGPGLG